MGDSFRPPSVPLIAVDPYFSVWSAADRLYDDHTRHWTNRRHSMTGMLRIDGKTRRFMGKLELSGDGPNVDEPEPMEQKSVKVDPLSTIYRFESEGVELTAKFTTPLLLDDLDALSRPVTYMTFDVRSVDGGPHEVKLYVDVSAELCVHSPDQIVGWSRATLDGGIAAMRIGTEEQPILQRVGDDTRIDWGYAYLAVPPYAGATTALGSYRARSRFAKIGAPPPEDEASPPRPAGEDTPVMSAVFDLGLVKETVSRYVMAAYDDIRSIEYFGKPLQAYWRRNGTTFERMLASAAADYAALSARCEAFDRQLIEEGIRAGGERYADVLSLSYRQAVAAHKLVAGEEGEALFFSKENFSNGCIATVDVSYPSAPLFLKYCPELVKGMLRPIFRYAAGETWPFEFAPHDVGCYPKANGQVYGDNKLEYQMPIEECGNMLVLSAAVCLYEDDASFAASHWPLLSRWAAYVLERGMDPDNQLCTDDFAGHLAHNANLSVKAIVGLGAYSLLCGMLGKQEESDKYNEAAKAMAAEWVRMAWAEDHTKLTFDGAPESWSFKYNLVWDRLLNLRLFPAEIAETEVRFYLERQNRFGTPLDSRESYTKADWLVWCASMADTKERFERMIRPLWDMLNESQSRVPFTDWYDTHTGKQMNFQNRSVVGGMFLPLLTPVGSGFAGEET
ncbi:DUF4965 domain-containing protein [Paenibacillus antri]|uniref:DUF4965 domain-containing protein n=1 Tax=Paenibacillus antri TaxID=2582848 RepID=A0A5R9G696_9BACL|nr:glutaminase family protein [Paenibacillus antri]TLS48484.1 DUF4965 domain-containing protein [Paenibacillus antri]